MKKVIVAGSRGFTNYELLKEEMSIICSGIYELEIVSGTARGADQLGEKWALENGFPVKRFPADWLKYGKSAGYVRNEQMAQYANCLIAFWDGISNGTKHMIELAKKYQLEIHIIDYENMI